MPKLYQTFILNLGYVESTRLGVLIVHHREGFESPLNAMKHFRDVLISYIVRPTETMIDNFDTCCYENAVYDPLEYFCTSCGTSLKKEVPPDRELNQEIFYLLSNMLTLDIDSASDMGLWDCFENTGWDLTAEITPNSDAVSIMSLGRWIYEGARENNHLLWFLPNGESGRG